jgi:hypothetical protein
MAANLVRHPSQRILSVKPESGGGLLLLRHVTPLTRRHVAYFCSGAHMAARHTRCYGRGHEILDLEHYLDVLERKPGAMKGCTPLQQWRQAGRWPACLDTIWHELELRHGKSKGTREMIGLVRAGSIDGWDKLITAVKDALRLGISDAAAVLHLLHMPDPEQRHQYAVALADELQQYERPMPVMDNYDLLLANTTGAIQ